MVSFGREEIGPGPFLLGWKMYLGFFWLQGDLDYHRLTGVFSDTGPIISVKL